MTTLEEMGARAKAAARVLATAGARKETALLAAAQALRDHSGALLAKNAEDVEAGRQSGMSESLLDRLSLTPERIEGMARAVAEVAQAPDPVGKVLSGGMRPNGLKI